MSEESNAEEDRSVEPERPPTPRVITADEFAAVDIEAPIRELSVGHAHPLADAYWTAHKQAEAANANSPSGLVYGLLFEICRIMLKVTDRGDPWQAFGSSGNWRTAIPSDFKGEQAEVIAGIVPDIVNPVLQARLADIVWSLNRKRAGLRRRQSPATSTPSRDCSPAI
jgi:hypothetical protein